MEGPNLNDVEFMKLINKHPYIKTRMEALLRVAEASIAGLHRADDVEMRVRDGVRELGQNIIEGWAASSEHGLAAKTAENKDLKKHTKKNSIGTQLSDQ